MTQQTSATPPKTAWVVFDTESVPNGELIRRTKFPGQEITVEDAIAKAMAEAKEKSWNGSDFLPVTFQMPICFAVMRLDAQYNLLGLTSYCEPTEAEITRKFWKGTSNYVNRDTGASLVSFNGRTFDVPLMEMAAFRHGVAANFHFEEKYGPRYRYGSWHFDILEFLTNTGACKLAGGLDVLCKSIGVPGKSGTNGGDVYQLWREGQYQAISNYCQRDVIDTYLVFLRCQVIRGLLTIDREAQLHEALAGWLKNQSSERPFLSEYLRDWRGL